MANENVIKAKPLGDRIIIKEMLAEETTQGGIILASSVVQDLLKGKVEAVGEGLYTQTGVKIPMTVEVGDVVLYNKFNATELRLGNEVYVILRESDLLVVMR
jgi:chaperonin GroES